MQFLEILSLLLFIVCAIPDLIRAKLRCLFPKKYSSARTVVALPYSHFCEKVFWAYDRSKVKYGTRTVAQGFWPTTLAEFSTKTVPIVVVEGGRVLKDSGVVLDSLAEEGHGWLYPTPAVRDEEREYSELGAAVARVIYHHLFTTDAGNRLLRRAWKVGITPLERLLCDPLYPACRMAMMGGLGITPSGPDQGQLAIVDKAFDRVSSLLGDGRKYLCGTDVMTAADLTFCSLAYPLVLPDEKGSVFVSWADDLPEGFRQEVRKRRESAAGQFVLRVYREERNV